MILAAAYRHLRVKGAKRSRMVPLKRSINEVFNFFPPFEALRSFLAFLHFPWLIRRITSLTRLFSVRLIIVPIYNLGHTTFFDAPGPGVSFTLFLNALIILFG